MRRWLSPVITLVLLASFPVVGMVFTAPAWVKGMLAIPVGVGLIAWGLHLRRVLERYEGIHRRD